MLFPRKRSKMFTENLQAYSILHLKALAADDEVGAWHAAATSAGRAGCLANLGGLHQLYGETIGFFFSGNLT